MSISVSHRPRSMDRSPFAARLRAMSAIKLTRRLTVYLSRDEELELEQLVRETKSSKAAIGLEGIRELLKSRRRQKALDEACHGESRQPG